MNMNHKKWIVFPLCAALLLSGAGAVAFAEEGQPSPSLSSSQAAGTKAETLSSVQNPELRDVPKQADDEEKKTSKKAESKDEKEKAEKNETVYVLTGPDGAVEKIIVSDRLTNPGGSESLADTFDLADMQVVKGDSSFANGQWQTGGGEVYYQGSSDKKTPVSLKVTYKLDGKPISPEELAGKSGKVNIRFDFENNQYETREVGGKKEKIYVPFTMLTGIILDHEVFSNIEVSNGKVINDGDRTVVVGVSFPGLQSNLQLDADKMELPDYFEVTADAVNFRLTNTLTMATNQLFSALGDESTDLDSPENLSDSLGQLTDAMSQLTDGSSQLYDGLTTLLGKSGELAEGVDQLEDGASQLKDGTARLKDGTKELKSGASSLAGGADSLASGAGELSGGASSLYSGLATLDSNSGTLIAGARQVFDVLLATANDQIAAAGLSVPPLTAENYAQVLDQVLSSLGAADIYNLIKSEVEFAVRANIEAIREGVIQAIEPQVTAKVTQAVRDEVETQVLQALGMTPEEFEAGIQAGVISQEQQEQVEAAVAAQMSSADVQFLIEQNVEEQMNSGEVAALIEENTEAQVELIVSQKMSSPEIQEKLEEASDQASAGASSLLTLKASLDSYNQFYTGLRQYTAGVAAAKDGASQISSGAGQLSSGASQLSDGAHKLKDGVVELQNGASDLYNGMDELHNGITTMQESVPALIDGVAQLQDGAGRMSDGLKEFDEEGVQKLLSAVDEDLGSFVDRLKTTAEVSSNYKSFAGISDQMDGSVKFIYRTGAIEAE